MVEHYLHCPIHLQGLMFKCINENRGNGREGGVADVTVICEPIV
jgi:hypothetical protein